MKKLEVVSIISEELNELIRGGILSTAAKPQILEIVDKVIINWQLTKVDNLRETLVSWEAAMGEGDRTLYSLGLRHAIDEILDIVVVDTNLKNKE